MLFRENAHTHLGGADDIQELGPQMGDARSTQEITGLLHRPTELFGRCDGAMTVAVNRAEHDIGLLDDRRQLFVTLLAIVPPPVPAHLLDEMRIVRCGFVKTINEMAKHGRNFILKMIFKIIKVFVTLM